MKTIKSIDLWTEQYENHYECFKGAFVDGFESILQELYDRVGIKSVRINMNEQPILNGTDKTKEIDVGSCDRWKLLYNMLKGSYTESDTQYGNYESDKYEFIPDLYIKYKLVTDTETFEIDHKCAFINTIKTRIIPIQENSFLTK